MLEKIEGKMGTPPDLSELSDKELEKRGIDPEQFRAGEKKLEEMQRLSRTNLEDVDSPKKKIDSQLNKARSRFSKIFEGWGKRGKTISAITMAAATSFAAASPAFADTWGDRRSGQRGGSSGSTGSTKERAGNVLNEIEAWSDIIDRTLEIYNKEKKRFPKKKPDSPQPRTSSEESPSDEGH